MFDDFRDAFQILESFDLDSCCPFDGDVDVLTDGAETSFNSGN